MDTEATEEDVVAESVPKEPVVSQLILVAVILLLVFSGGIFQLVTQDQEASTANLATNTSDGTAAEEVIKIDPFENISIAAKSAFVFDVKTQKVLYSKNPDKALPLASITKLMTALVAHEVLDDSEVITITDKAILQDGGSGFAEGETFSRSTLSEMTLQSSSNDGAFALAVAAGDKLKRGGGAQAFVEAMNVTAAELGLTNSYFRNPTGLDTSAAEAGAYGSARDIAFLMQHLLLTYPALLAATTELNDTFYSKSGKAYQSSNTNQYTGDVPRLIGSKTGYTELAGGNLVVAFDAAIDRPVVVVTLQSTRSQRFSDVETLVNATILSVQ